MPGILLATGGRPSSDGAARLAALAAERLGVSLQVVVAHEPLPVYDYAFGATYVPTQEDDAAVCSALVVEASEQLRRCGVAGVTPAVRTGFVAQQIADAARELRSELIVAGLGPHNVANRALGGETALQLAQIASTPVLAVPASATTLPRRAVVAIDFSPTSVRAAGTVARLLTAGDTLYLVHVAPPTGGKAAKARGESPPTPVAEQLRSMASAIGAPAGVRVERVELHGDPARAILEQAKRVDADLIALGSHGYGLWKRLVLGSVASKMIRVAECSVLVAPIGCL
jgi:nucleotide-binding universal stress UspA family protein